MPRACASVVGLRTDNGEDRRNTNGCKFYENDADAMRMMLWDEMQDKNKMQNNRQKPNHGGNIISHLRKKARVGVTNMESCIRGVTTLHHYERISSRDLGWHRRENRKGREEVKLSCFFDKWVKPRTLRGWTNWKKEYNRDERDCKQSVRKEEQGTLRELEGWKDMNQEFNGQDRIRNHSG